VFRRLTAECRTLGLSQSKPAPSNRAQFAVAGNSASWLA
jgi:hypothetical protein